MKINAAYFWKKNGFTCAPFTWLYLKLFSCLVLLILIFGGLLRAHAEQSHVVLSMDGTKISYEILGSGEPALIFVHGWSCDARFWREQVRVFSGKHRVVTLDLAGHGHSGMSRSKYTMAAFGEDVRAVTQAVGADKVILIGHSMGGSVIAEAARLMPDIVVGLIGIDTFHNIEYGMTTEELEEMIAPLERNFRFASRQFVAEMISADTDRQLRDWILSEITAAPQAVALSAMNEMMMQYVTGEAANVFDEIRIPVVAVNGDMWPINYEANRRHMLSFEAVVLRDADHFLMLNRPEDFNKALKNAIRMILKKTDTKNNLTD